MTNPIKLPKPTKKRKSSRRSASEQRHCNAIHEMACIVTGCVLVIWHHVDTGIGRKKNDFMTIPLHPSLHTKDERLKYQRLGYDHLSYAVHENKFIFENSFGTETELLLKTYERLDAINRLEPLAREIWESMR